MTITKGTQEFLLLGYPTRPAIVHSDNIVLTPSVLPLERVTTGAVILISPYVSLSDIALARSQAPESIILSHLPDSAQQDEIVDRIQHGADDVIFDSQLQLEQILSNRIVIATERRLVRPAQSETSDTLTGLLDRTQLLQELQILLDQPQHPPAAVMVLDIHNFKSITDSLGHEVGDELLKTVGERLQSLEQDGAICARIGHDHFAIVVNQVIDAVSTGIYAEAIVSMLRQPYHLGSTSQAIYITVSLGLTLQDTGEADADDMVREANIALSQAREAGRPIARFEPILAADVHYKQLLRNDLHSALRGNEFFLLYQPQTDMRSGAMIGVEALLRWQHPSLGVIPADEFIPLLEETDLITEVGRWVIETACKQLREWQQGNGNNRTLSIAINISSKQFHDSDLASFIEQAIVQNAISPRLLKLELTESLLVIDTDDVADKLYRLKSLGISICIDDFGTGYASLSYLRQFPIDVLKIDKTFVQNIGISEQNDAIVVAIINLAHDLHFHVIAEGVENTQQQAFLTQHHCDTFQGFLFSKPLRASQVSSGPRDSRPGNYIHVA